MAPKHPHKILIVEDDPLFARTLRLQLGAGPFELTFCAHTAQAITTLGQQPCDLVLLDIHLGGHEEGLTALPKLIARAPDVPVVVHSVLSDHATVVRAMRQGAHDYIPKHVGIKTLGAQLCSIIEQHRRNSTAGAAHRAEAKQRPNGAGPAAVLQQANGAPMLGQSAAMAQLHGDIARARRSQGSVIILGEPGSGKELVARALGQPGVPFVAVDASTLEGSLASSMLFGHERGAFTGADVARAGLFEQAHGGVLYIDEVANMSLEVQAKLLRVLQEREVTRLGGSTSRPLTFRLVCATHNDLQSMSAAGKFRFDLLTRLQVFVLQVPTLRERMADVPELFSAFVARFSADMQVPPLPVAAATWAALAAYHWPGNVRELLHAAQYAVAACDGPQIGPAHLPAQVTTGRAKAAPPLDVTAAAGPAAVRGLHTGVSSPAAPAAPTFNAMVQAFERTTLEAAYGQSSGNISAMARRLGMDRSSLYAKLRLYGIHPLRP